MPLDSSALALAAFIGVSLIALSLTFFYGVTPLDHRFVVRGRRAILKYDSERFPFRSAWPGLLPVGVAILLLLVGEPRRGKSGRSIGFRPTYPRASWHSD